MRPSMPIALGLILIAALTRAAAAAEIHVAPAGDDAAAGTAEKPFRSLARAAAVLQPGDTCVVHDGVYREILRPARSGAADRPMVFRAADGARPLLAGADPVRGWRAESNGSWSAPMAWDLRDGNQVFAGDRMLDEARWPNPNGHLLQPARAAATRGTATTLTDTNLPGHAGDWVGALLWCAGGDRWICWSATVTGFDPATRTLTFEGAPGERWYTVRAGSPYVLMGPRHALDAPGEWWYDRAEKRLWLRPPDGRDPNGLGVEAKARPTVIDLAGREHIRLSGLRFRAGGLKTDAASRHLVLERLEGLYVAHSFRNAGDQGVAIRGEDILVRDCEFACSAESVLSLAGRGNRVVNCFIHDGNYRGSWEGAVAASGRRQVIAWSTIRDAGRDVLTLHGLAESLLEHNDLSRCGRLTRDLGLTYGHTTDFGATEIRYNRVHDNLADGLGMGIYFDHLSLNVLVHHNAIWNIPGEALRVNNPSFFCLVTDNLCWNTNEGGKRPFGTFDHSRRDDLFGCRFENNRAPAPFRMPPASGAVVTGNTLTAEAPAAPPWPAGHDFARADTPSPAWSRPQLSRMNLLLNPAFEYGTLEGWEAVGGAAPEVAKGNGWGNRVYGEEDAPTGTGRHVLRLGGAGALRQPVALKPRTRYQLSGWVKTSAAGVAAAIELTGHGGPPAAAESAEPTWRRLVVDVETGEAPVAAAVRLRGASADGSAWFDNLGLIESDPP